MSFREQRNFIEILRNLGYGQTIRYDSTAQHSTAQHSTARHQRGDTIIG